MIWNVPEIIAQLSKQYELYSGMSFLPERPQALVRFALETILNVLLSDWGCSASASGNLIDDW